MSGTGFGPGGLPEPLIVAERAFRFRPAAEALADPVHFVADAMTYRTADDPRVRNGIIAIEDLRDVLDRAAPGLFDQRSWAHWHVKCGRSSAPPLPVRRGVQPVVLHG